MQQRCTGCISRASRSGSSRADGRAVRMRVRVSGLCLCWSTRTRWTLAMQASADGLCDLFNDSMLITPFNNIALAAVYGRCISDARSM